MAPRPSRRTPVDILKLVGEADEPFLWMSEIADRAGYSEANAVKDKLLELYAEGYVDYRSRNAYIWWLTDAGRAYLDDLED